MSLDLRLRAREETDHEFILGLTERELVPILEKAWNFTWDKGHAQKFLLDMATIGETRVASLQDEPVGYVWYRVMRRPGLRLRSRRLLWLNYLVLDRKAQNRGLGKRIMQIAKRRRGLAVCKRRAMGAAGEFRALEFYRRLGYRQVREEQGNLRMRKAVVR